MSLTIGQKIIKMKGTTSLHCHSIFIWFSHGQNVPCADIILSDTWLSAVFFFVWVEALSPSQQFFSHVGTEPPLPGYYQYFLGGKSILLKDTTRRPE